MNQIFIICPYSFGSAWVFDDERVGLVREPFVESAGKIIDVLVAKLPEAEKGFTLLFSSGPFDGYQKLLHHTTKDVMEGNPPLSNRFEQYEVFGGHYYSLYDVVDPPIRCWLCPAMFKYFESAPKHIYVQAKAGAKA
jgi:hypothetical protein